MAGRRHRPAPPPRVSAARRPWLLLLAALVGARPTPVAGAGVGCADVADGTWVRAKTSAEAGNRTRYDGKKCANVRLLDVSCARLPENARAEIAAWTWAPKACGPLAPASLASFEEVLGGRRLVFVGDSLNRNMAISARCISGLPEPRLPYYKEPFLVPGMKNNRRSTVRLNERSPWEQKL